MEKLKIITKYLLLAFVFVSIGFALGKNFREKPIATNLVQENNHKALVVRVYYLYSAFRCTTCNSIEKRTKEILESDFKSEIDNGVIQWETDDFQKNETLARKFDIISSCVVVALAKGDEVVYFKILDDTWTLFDKPAEFDSYIRTNIQEVLKMMEQET